MKDFSEVFPDEKEQLDEAFEIVYRLKRAALSLQGDPSWASSDGISQYSAHPLRFRDGEELSPDVEVFYNELGNISQFVRDTILNAWQISSLDIDDINMPGEVTVRSYLLDQNAVLVSQQTVSPEMFGNSTQAEFLKIVFQSEQRDAPIKLASVRDFANLQNALYDLEDKVEVDELERQNRIEQLSKEELRAIRTQERQAHRFREPREVELPAEEGQIWWKIEYGYGYGGMRVYSILADSAEDAVLDLEDFFNMKTLIFEEAGYSYNVKPYGKKKQTQLGERYEGRNFVRVFPFSLVEISRDLDSATPEQRAAYDVAIAKLGRGVFG
jgi:hypothetical protein